MSKILIIDDKENADIAAAILRRRYDVITAEDEKGLKERMFAETPDFIMITADSPDINYKKALLDTVRRTPEFENMPAAIITSSPVQSLMAAAGIMGAEVISRPYEPLDFIKKADWLAEQLIPVKERVDAVTGLHKREFTEERIQELFPKKSGTLFIIDVAKFRFASQPISEEISKLSAEVVEEEAKAFGAILGIQKDRKLIGYLPDINERAICQSWAKNVIRKIQEKLGDQKIYISIGFACNDEKSAEYLDLYKLCDRGLNLSRERGSNQAAYY